MNSPIDVHIVRDFQYNLEASGDSWRKLPTGALVQLDFDIAAAVMIAGAGRLPRNLQEDLLTSFIADFEAQYGVLTSPPFIEGTRVINGTPIVQAVTGIRMSGDGLQT